MSEEITERVHSKDDLETAIKASSILFGKSTTEDLKTLDETTLLQVFEGVPQAEVSKSDLNDCDNITTFLSETTCRIIFKSKGEARKMIQGGGVSINKQKVLTHDAKVEFDLLQDKYLLAQRGKKNYFLIKVV